jgi:hypothetical protein
VLGEYNPVEYIAQISPTPLLLLLHVVYFCDALIAHYHAYWLPVAPWTARGMVPWLCPGRRLGQGQARPPRT